MLKLPTIPLAQALLMLGLGVAVMAVVVFFARRYRDDDGEDRVDANNMLTKFRELHAKGDLSEAEFRTIKTKLASKLQDELKDTDQTG